MMCNLNRRDFFVAGAGTALASNLPTASAAEFPHAVVQANDDAVAKSMDAQATDTSHPFRGGIADARELYLAGAAGRFIQQAVAAHFCESSRFFKDDGVVERIQYALSFLQARQSSDGNIDLLTTNFNSPPDTGFVVHKVASARTSRTHEWGRPSRWPIQTLFNERGPWDGKRGNSHAESSLGRERRIGSNQ